MNQFLKSIFISTYPIFCLVGIVFSAREFLGGNTLTAIGLFLVSIPMLVFLALLFLNRRPRTKANLPFYSLLIGFGSIALIYSQYQGDTSWLYTLGLVNLAGWLLYLFWYSRFSDRTNDLLSIGQTLPTFNLVDENGEVVSTKTLKGKAKILLFYRGNWCPLCTAQIDELVAEYKTLEAKGVETLLISPQPQGHSKRLAEKHNVNFRFLVDKSNALAKKWKLFSKMGLPAGFQVFGYESGTVLPTVVLTDTSDKIVYSDLTSNYRVRPEPREFLPYFD